MGVVAAWSIRIAGLGVATLGVAACGEGAPGAGSTVRDTLPSGVERVTIASPAEPSAPHWKIVEELRVGSLQSSGPDAFGWIVGLAALDGGGFAVFDYQSQELRLFDFEGGHLATHGGRGDGPGETQGGNGVMLDPGGRLWVPDDQRGRMSVFHPGSGFEEAHEYTSFSWGPVWRGAMGEDGNVFRPLVEYDKEPPSRALVVYDSTMTPLDSLPMGVYPTFDDSPGAYCYSNEGGGGCQAVPFYGSEIRLVDPQGSVWEVEDAGEYRLRRWTPGGDTAFVVVVDRPGAPVTAAERDSAIAELRERVGPGVELDPAKIPAVKPVIESLFMPGDGNLWVHFASSGGAAFDVLAPNGSYLGTAVADIAIETGDAKPVLQDGRLWLVAKDALDVNYVVRARLEDAR